MYKYRKIGLVIGIGVLAAFVLIAIFSPVLAPYDPYKITGAPLEEPNRNHLLGTNNMGQDIFSRLLCGTRATLIVGFGGALLMVLIGTCVGIISGYYGGKIDELLTRAVDVVMALPMFPLLIMLAMFLKPSILTLIFLMGILGWTGCARIIRSQVLLFSESNFISGAKAIGASDIYIMVKHVFPNILPLVLVKFVFATQDCMLMEVGLGFLGLGDPFMIDWGQMINRAYIKGGFALGLWWWLLPPGFSIAFLSLAVASVGHSFENEINPRLRRMIL